MAKFEIVNTNFRKQSNSIRLPSKATQHSAGYDFYSPIDIEIKPHKSYLLWTDIKAKIDEDECLLLAPRSSVAVKKHIMLTNSIGIIDSDYYNNSDNDGNIGIHLYNYGETISKINKNERIVQGIIIKISKDKIIKTWYKRKGGFGSTGG